MGAIGPLSAAEAAFERDGYRAAATGHDRADGGVDLVLRRKGRQTYVQCKRWKQNQLVGVEQVRSLHGVAAAEGADSSVFVISGIFSEPARQFARKVGMRLIDGDELVRFVSELDTYQPPKRDRAFRWGCERQLERRLKDGRVEGRGSPRLSAIMDVVALVCGVVVQVWRVPSNVRGGPTSIILTEPRTSGELNVRL